MKKVIMVDGNNLLFRSYYATAYSGNLMKNSKGFPTNGLFGFVNMINKIIKEENPEYMVVAFDKGKTFRNEIFKEYKEGRIEMPDDLRLQFPIAKEILASLGIKALELDNYEADDIIGAYANYCDRDDHYQGLIISSDKDLLQLISNQVEIKLLKQKDYIRYDLESFIKEYQINPVNVVDLKALQGDSSDNIPGVKGIGEKTALKLIQEYQSLDGVYQNIEKISGKVKEKLEQDKENAYLSYQLAKIEKEPPFQINIEEIKKEKIKEINNISEINLKKEFAFFLELDQTNYHQASIVGLAIYNEEDAFYLKKELIIEAMQKLKMKMYTYDYKRAYVALKRINFELDQVVFDTLIAAYLLEYNIKEDIAYLAKQFNYQINENNNDMQSSIEKAKFIYQTKKQFEQKLKEEQMLELFHEIDFPLTKILGNMEFEGVCVDQGVLAEMGEEIKIKIDLLSEEIYSLAGEKFNISSPKQLGPIIFEKLGLKRGKKTKTGFSTASDVLESLQGKHPIIDKLLEYRILTKLYSTYIEGLISTINNQKIHTIYNQTLTRTGRLSSVSPNLQNIPIRYEYGRLIRKAFKASQKHILISVDYSQIELRVLAHMANVESLIEAFKNNQDIHTKTAQDIFNVEIINTNQRRVAKAINFGIIYGMSEYGLAENLKISMTEAREFIENYFRTYPGIKAYMEETIKEATDKGYVLTIFKRKRKIDELANKNYMIRKQGERIALNTPIQGTSADILKMAMIKIDQKFNELNLKSKMILQVHDELVFDVVKEEKEMVKKIIKQAMENCVGLKVPLKADIAEGSDWYTAK